MKSPETEELHALCDRLCEGQLSPVEAARLEALVCEDAGLRQLYVERMHDHAALAVYAGQLRESPSPLPAAVESNRRPAWRPAARAWFALAAAVAVMAGAVWFTRAPAAAPTVATIVSSVDAKWKGSALPTSDGAALPRGRLHLEEGAVQIRFHSGAEFRLEAPSEFELVDPRSGHLHSGIATALVPERANGFTVLTPFARIFDRGAAFGLSVQPGGYTVVRVLSGNIELQHAASGQAIRLVAREAAEVVAQHVRALNSPTVEPALYGTPLRDDVPDTPARRLNLNSAIGAGAAAYAASPGSTMNRSDTLLLVKNHELNRSYLRKACVRFDLSPLRDEVVQTAALTLNFETTGFGFASLTDACTFAVYGVTADEDDAWTPETLTWETMPAFDADPGRANSARATKLGTFVLPAGVVSGTFGISGDALVEFLNRDRNRLATLVIVRETTQPLNTAVHGFAGNNHPTLAPPTLQLVLQQRRSR